jgi:hypothetical protein
MWRTLDLGVAAEPESVVHSHELSP